MADKTENQPEGWNDGMAKMMEATRHNMTAVNLAMAGGVALGAAAVAYMWDAQRRNNLIDTTRQWTDNMTSYWQRTPTAPEVNP